MTAKESGQSTVELAIGLPAVMVVLLLVVQVAVLARDRVTVVHAARAAARTALVTPTVAAATRAAHEVGANAASSTVRFDGATTPGGLLGVTVTSRPTQLPIVGRLVAGVTLSERFVVLVEDGP